MIYLYYSSKETHCTDHSDNFTELDRYYLFKNWIFSQFTSNKILHAPVFDMSLGGFPHSDISNTGAYVCDLI